MLQQHSSSSRPHSHPSSIASGSDQVVQVKSEPSDPENLEQHSQHPLNIHHHHSSEMMIDQQDTSSQHSNLHQQHHQHHHQLNQLQHLAANSANNLYYQNSNSCFETKSESGSSDILSRPATPNSAFGVNNLHADDSSTPSSNNAGSTNTPSSAANSTMGPPKKFQLNSKIFDKSFDTSANIMPGTNSAPSSNSSNSTSSGKRANRTRFTDYQIKVLQEFFENNSYPKDSDLEYLSKLLLLSPRVIVVWFQVGPLFYFPP